jgi:hypothetical protein
MVRPTIGVRIFRNRSSRRSAGPSTHLGAANRSTVALCDQSGHRSRRYTDRPPRSTQPPKQHRMWRIAAGGAGGARTRDRQITRSTLSRSTRLASNDASRQCHERTRSTGFFRDRGPRLGPRRISLPGASPSRYVSHATIYPVRLQLSRTRSSACQMTAGVRAVLYRRASS